MKENPLRKAAQLAELKRNLIKCPKCKNPMQLISMDVDKIPKTSRYEVKYRYYCNKCRKPHFVKIGERE